MGRPELGTKCTCTGCHGRFYDLNNSPATCPKCGVQQAPESPRAIARPSRSTYGARFQPRQSPLVADAIEDDAGAEGATKVAEDVEDPDPDPDDEVDDEIEAEPDLVR